MRRETSASFFRAHCTWWVCLLLLISSCYPEFKNSDDDDSVTGDDDDSAPGDDDDSVTGDDDDSAPGDDDDSQGSIDADFWLVGVTLIDLEESTTSTGDEDWLLEGMNIAVLDGVVVAVTASLPEGIPLSDQKDHTGLILLPGFIDSRVHLAEDGSTEFTGDHVLDHLRAQLASGVTTVVDGGGPSWVMELRDRVALDAGTPGSILGPRILASGPFLTSSGQYPCQQILRTDRCHLIGEDEGSTSDVDIILSQNTHLTPNLRSLVLETHDTLRERGHMWPGNDNNEVFCGPMGAPCASLSPARRNYILNELDDSPVAVPTMIYALSAHHYTGVNNAGGLLSNMPLSNHLPIIAQVPFVDPIGTSSGFNAIPNVFSHMVSGLIAIDALNHALTLGDALTGTSSIDPLSATRLAATIPEETRNQWITTLNSVQSDTGYEMGLEHWYEKTVPTSTWQSEANGALARLMPYGLPLVAGSGAGSLFVPHGLGLHWELQRLDDSWQTSPQALVGSSAQLPDNWDVVRRREALRAATVLPAELLGLVDRGAIEVGRKADFVLLQQGKNPLDDIKNTELLHRVYLGGQELQPASVALSSGPYSAQVQAKASPALDGTCFIDNDCAQGYACDLVNHTCRSECTSAGAFDECDESSYCAAADGLAAEQSCAQGFWPTADTDNDGAAGCSDNDCFGSPSCSSTTSSSRSFVCREGHQCDPYQHNPSASGCPGAAEPYLQSCVPADLNTNACVTSIPVEDVFSTGTCDAGVVAEGRYNATSACPTGMVCDWLSGGGVDDNQCIAICSYCDFNSSGSACPPLEVGCNDCYEVWWSATQTGPGQPVFYGYCSGEYDCNNGLDDDGDGFYDCGDPDCINDSFCP
jgi:hypothetical protein